VADALTEPGLSIYFTLEVDYADLGPWSTCQGLGVEIENEHRNESSMADYMHQFTGRYSFTNLVLGRPICADTKKVMSWITGFATIVVPTSASLKALDPAGGEIMSWDLSGVVPVRWTGPSFNTAELQVASESLELAYTGFL